MGDDRAFLGMATRTVFLTPAFYGGANRQAPAPAAPAAPPKPAPPASTLVAQVRALRRPHRDPLWRQEPTVASGS